MLRNGSTHLHSSRYSPSTRIVRAHVAQKEQSMKITDVEAIYVRLQQVKEQCDSGQDALVVRVRTDEGITGIGEVDSSPAAVQGAILGPYSHTITSGLKHLLIGEDLFRTEFLWNKMY